MFVLSRKSTTTKWQTSSKRWAQRPTTRCRRTVATRREKCKRPSSSARGKRQSRARWSSNKTIRRRDTWPSRLNKRTGWRTRLSSSRNTLHQSRLSRTRTAVSTTWRGSTMTRWQARTTWDSKRRRKSCRWRNLRWSWSRSCRTHRLSRRMLTRSWSVPSRSQVPWWTATWVEEAWRLASETTREVLLQLLSNELCKVCCEC